MADLCTMHYHFYPPGYTGSDPRLDQVLSLLNILIQDDAKMSQSLTDLQTAQTATDDAISAAVAEMTDAENVLATLAGKITSAGTDPVALAAVVADLTTQSSTLASATSTLKSAADALKAAPPPPPPPGPVAGAAV